MGIVLTLTGLVLLVSLYDYYTSRTWQQVTSGMRNEVVFEDRNRAYGAYQIRQNYNKNLLLIIGIMVASMGLAFGIHQYVKSLPEEEDLQGKDSSQFTMEAPPLDEEVVPPPPQEPIPPMERTIEFLPPVVTDEEVDNPPPIQENMEDVNASTSTNDTDEENFAPPVTSTPPPVEKKEEETFTFVDETAEFPGGYAEMSKYIAKNIKYPQEAIEMGIEGKTFLRFVVGKDGNIEDVRVLRGLSGCTACDKEAQRVVRSMPNWKPGKNGGKAVRSYFDLPVSFRLN
ncbi:MAG: energy transducer TonB [Bacteroidota bacterium]